MTAFSLVISCPWSVDTDTVALSGIYNVLQRFYIAGTEVLKYILDKSGLSQGNIFTRQSFFMHELCPEKERKSMLVWNAWLLT